MSLSLAVKGREITWHGLDPSYYIRFCPKIGDAVMVSRLCSWMWSCSRNFYATEDCRTKKGYMQYGQYGSGISYQSDRMIQILLPEEPIFRGESLKGGLHISSLSSDRAREIKAVVLMREWYINKLGHPSWTEHEELLFLEHDIEITPTGIHHTIDYPIPKDAPFTFEDRPVKIEWGVKVLVRKSRFFKESAFQKFTVLPHVLKSESPPLIDRVPIPTPEHGFISDLSSEASQMWRSFGPFSKSEGLCIQLEKSVYFPGDTVTGSIYFSRHFEDAVLSIYLIFVRKLKTVLRPGEKEHLMVRSTNTFQAESEVPFSFVLSPLTCPEFETGKWKVSWKVRAIVTRGFRIGKYAESYIRIRSLEF